jgi:hypothetical protein
MRGISAKETEKFNEIIYAANKRKYLKTAPATSRDG